MGREHVLEVAERLFGDQGYQATSFEQIAAGSEFSVAAVYTLFVGKQDLLQAVLSRRFVEMRHAVVGILDAARPGLDEVLALCEYYLDYFRAHPSFGRLTLRVFQPVSRRCLISRGISRTPPRERGCSPRR